MKYRKLLDSKNNREILTELGYKFILCNKNKLKIKVSNSEITILKELIEEWEQ